MHTSEDSDTGSIKVGDIEVDKGDWLKIVGENALRRVSCVMGNGDNKCVYCKGTGPMPLGEVTWDIVRIYGVDPAPVGGLDCFNGTNYLHIPSVGGREGFEALLGHTDKTLIAWDAPISFDRAVNFYTRPIEQGDSPLRCWLADRVTDGSIEQGAVNIRAFAGCPHWSITCDCLGMPYGQPPQNLQILGLPEQAWQVNEANVNFVIEVHPAVSMAVWWIQQQTHEPFPKYKNIPNAQQDAAIQMIWAAFVNANLADDNTPVPENDNQLDAWVAWKMSVDFLSGEACWVGTPHSGGFVLPAAANEMLELPE
jgi:hypothetical protein